MAQTAVGQAVVCYKERHQMQTEVSELTAELNLIIKGLDRDETNEYIRLTDEFEKEEAASGK